MLCLLLLIGGRVVPYEIDDVIHPLKPGWGYADIAQACYKLLHYPGNCEAQDAGYVTQSHFRPGKRVDARGASNVVSAAPPAAAKPVEMVSR